MNDVRQCLSGKRLAFVGLSSDPESFSRAILSELAQRDYEVVPVHPTADQVAGRPACRSVGDIRRPVDWVLIMTPASASAAAIADAVAAGATRVWVHRGSARLAATREAIDAARNHGAIVVAGECPAMYLPDAIWIHRAHRWLRNVTGTAPREVEPAADPPRERRARTLRIGLFETR